MADCWGENCACFGAYSAISRALKAVQGRPEARCCCSWGEGELVKQAWHYGGVGWVGIPAAFGNFRWQLTVVEGVQLLAAARAGPRLSVALFVTSLLRSCWWGWDASCQAWWASTGHCRRCGWDKVAIRMWWWGSGLNNGPQRASLQFRHLCSHCCKLLQKS